MFKPLPALAAAVLLTVLPAAMHGAYTNRWGEPATARPAPRIENLAAELGDWRLVSEEKPLTEFIQRELALSSHISRSYRNVSTGQVVGVLLMAGEPGPLVRHPPTICYENKANQPIGNAAWLEPTSTTDVRLKLLKYEPPSGVESQRFFIAYGHTIDAAWDAPTFPRIAYGGAPRLYKVQLLTTIGAPGQEPEVRAGLEDFAARFASGFRRLMTKDAELQP